MSLHTLQKAHSGIVQLFLLFIIVKVILMFVNRDKFINFRAKTKVVDMVLGTLLLVTGFLYLNAKGWPLLSQPVFILKLIAAIASIPLAIIAFKKENKVLAIVSILVMVVAYYIGKVVLAG